MTQESMVKESVFIFERRRILIDFFKDLNERELLRKLNFCNNQELSHFLNNVMIPHNEEYLAQVIINLLEERDAEELISQ